MLRNPDHPAPCCKQQERDRKEYHCFCAMPINAAAYHRLANNHQEYSAADCQRPTE